MSQNPEALNKAISDALKKVDRSKRLRGVRFLILGGAAFLLFFAPSVFRALNGFSTPIYISTIVSISILIMIYGSILLLFGSTARSYYQRLKNKASWVRIVFYIVLFILIVGLTWLMNSFFSEFTK